MTEIEDTGMRKRQIALKDGRYMIFYTFEDDSRSPTDEDSGTSGSRSAPEAKAPSGRQRDV
ncbi:MAG: hypothetical protein H0V62_03980 [Gammaproteobacteria bacterium]|nr:hypothetical protein [Gammaproteobacteria bacterium]